LGNHDISYIYNNNKDYNRAWNKTPRFYCSGITGSKVSAFRKEFYSKNLRDKFFIEYFKPCIRIDGVTYSHAGISTHHFPYGYNIERFIELANEVWREFRNECHPHYHILAGVGTSRGGRDTVGGVLWQDWRYDFFASYDIGKQIVGHTIVPGPDVAAEGTPYESWNIDTNSNHYAVVTDGNIQIKENYLWKNLAISHRTVRHDF
jgi:hypothetical protein